MQPLFAADLALGTVAIVGGVWIRRRVVSRPPLVLDDRVVAADVASGLRMSGAAVLLFGLLAVSGLPGGFDLPVWSTIALALGATSVAILAVRWRWEGWALRDEDPDPDRASVQSETWQYGLLAGGATTFVAYFVGLGIGSMQPVHAVVAILEGAAGYALGLAIATPQLKIIHARPTAPSEIVPTRSTGRRRTRRRL